MNISYINPHRFKPKLLSDLNVSSFQLDYMVFYGKDNCLFLFACLNLHSLAWHLAYYWNKRAAVCRRRKSPMDAVLRINGICKLATASGNLLDGCQVKESISWLTEILIKTKLEFLQTPVKKARQDPSIE